MANIETEKKFTDILSRLNSLDFHAVCDAFVELLGLKYRDGLLDLEELLETKLERKLDQTEIFKLRPIVTEIEANYYEEE